MEIAPAGVVDPTPFLYDTSFYTIAAAIGYCFIFYSIAAVIGYFLWFSTLLLLLYIFDVTGRVFILNTLSQNDTRAQKNEICSLRQSRKSNPLSARLINVTCVHCTMYMIDIHDCYILSLTVKKFAHSN